MSGAIQITPGYLPPDGQPITEAQLRLMAQPTGQIPPGTVTDKELDIASVQNALDLGNTVRPNLLVNGNFTEERWLAETVSAPIGVDTVLAEGWFANPTGAAITYGQGVSVPNVNSILCAILTGAVGTTAVDFGQNLPRSASGLLWKKLTFTAYILNNTGASFVPKLVLSTANVVNDFTAVNQQLATDLVTCPNEAWTKITLTFDPGAFAGMNAGLRLALRFPTGTLNAGGKTISIAQAKLEIGEAATPMPWDNGPDAALLMAALNPTLNAMQKGNTPVGGGMDYWGTVLPDRWIWANGRTDLAIATYPKLFAVFGTYYGGDGITTFGVPDKRHRTSVGRGTMGGVATPARLTTAVSGVDGDTLGAAGGDQRMQQHNHNYSYTHGTSSGTGSGGHEADPFTSNTTDNGTTNNAGDGASQNVQPTIVCNYIIFAGV